MPYSGGMQDNNPYSAPQSGPGFASLSDRNRLWSAYLVAPFFAPLLGAIVVASIGFITQLTQPDDPGFNPMSLIFGPLCLMIVGVPAAYGVAGLVGMPSVYWLRSRGRLNALSVHVIGLICAAIPGILFSIIGLLMIVLGATNWSEIGEILLSGFVAFLVLSPFTLISATVFWWIGVRIPKASA